MTAEQAQRIGRMVATARRRHGLSLRRLAVEVGISFSSLQKLEKGEQPWRSDWMIRIADVLGIDPERFRRVADTQMSASLPSVRTYFRAKYDLGAEEIDEIEQAVREIRRRYELE